MFSSKNLTSGQKASSQLGTTGDSAKIVALHNQPRACIQNWPNLRTINEIFMLNERTEQKRSEADKR